MELLQFQQSLKDLVASDKLADALALIIRFCQDTSGYEELENTAIINSSKLDRIEREKNEDRIASEDYSIQRGQITAAILSIVTELKEKETIPIPGTQPALPAQSAFGSTTSGQVSQQDIQQLIVNHDKIFIKIILGILVISIGFFVFYMIQEKFVLGGTFFSSASGTVYIYLNNKKRMLHSISASI